MSRARHANGKIDYRKAGGKPRGPFHLAVQGDPDTLCGKAILLTTRVATRDHAATCPECLKHPLVNS